MRDDKKISLLIVNLFASFPKTMFKGKPRKPSFICIVNKDQEKLAGLIYTLIYIIYIHVCQEFIKKKMKILS